MTVAAVGTSSSSSSASPYGLNFQSLLQIILTQLTYQDPLKPMDNFEFVSQLAQFSQLEQSQTLNTDVSSLLSAQATTQATTLLGKTVDYTTGASSSSSSASSATPLTGTVQAVSLSSGTPTVTVQGADGSTTANIALSQITQVR
jgi:flagellar basal-body rod modification protein FlgD